MDLLEAFAHSLSGDPSVRVVMRGNECFVDLEKKSITVPAIHISDVRKVPSRLIGHLNHELGHLYSSAVGERKRIESAFPNNRYEQALALFLHNAFDDCWQEPRFVAKYPGARNFLGARAVFALEKILAQEQVLGGSQFKSLKDKRTQAAIAYLHRYHHSFHKLDIDMPKSVTPEALALVEKWFPGDYTALTNLTAAQITDRVIEFMKANPYVPPAPPAPKPSKAKAKAQKEEDNEDDEDGEDGSEEESDEDGDEQSGPGGIPTPDDEGDGDSEEESEDDGEESDESDDSEDGDDDSEDDDDEGDEDDEESDDEDDEAESSDSDSGEGQEASLTEDTSPEAPEMTPEEKAAAEQADIDFLNSLGHSGSNEEFAKELEEVASETPSNGVYPPYTTEEDQVFPLKEWTVKQLQKSPSLMEKFGHSINIIDATTVSALGALQRKFIGRHKARKGYGDDGYEFTEEAFTSIAARDFKNLFRTKSSRNSIKGTAVTLLLDVSGSMSTTPNVPLLGGKTNAAVAAIWSVWALAQTLQCPFEILAYTTSTLSKEGREKMGPGFDYQRYRRTEPVIVHVIKPFNERWGFHHKLTLAALMATSRGAGSLLPLFELPRVNYSYSGAGGPVLWSGTIDGDAMFVARQRIQKRKEERKIMIVVCDGQPNDGKTGDHLRYEIKRCAQSGIQTVGVGIGSEGKGVEKYYPVCRTVTEVTGMNLGKALLELL